jgi:hypothetical protein
MDAWHIFPTNNAGVVGVRMPSKYRNFQARGHLSQQLSREGEM